MDYWGITLSKAKKTAVNQKQKTPGLSINALSFVSFFMVGLAPHVGHDRHLRSRISGDPLQAVGRAP